MAGSTGKLKPAGGAIGAGEYDLGRAVGDGCSQELRDD
jgi:hypothetical protein